MSALALLLLEPFTHGFMLRAMGIGAFVCAVCALLSPFVVLKGWSLVGDAVSHAVLPGIVLAWLAGVPLALGAVASGIACVSAAGFVGERTRVKPDAVLGILFTGFLAGGIILVTAYPAEIHFTHILLGNLLGVTDDDLAQILVLGGAAVAILAVRGRDLVFFCFDPVGARTVGLAPSRLQLLLLVLVAATVVAALQAVGLVLVLAMLITPGCVGLLLARRFGRVVSISVGSAIASAVLGTAASFWLDGSTGPCIVLAQAILFALAFGSARWTGRGRAVSRSEAPPAAASA